MNDLPLAPLVARALGLGFPSAALARMCGVSQKTLRGWADGSRTPRAWMESDVRRVLDRIEYPVPSSLFGAPRQGIHHA